MRCKVGAMSLLTEEELYCDAEEELYCAAEEINDENHCEHVPPDDSEFSGDDDYEDDFDSVYENGSTRLISTQHARNQQSISTKISAYQPSENLFRMYRNKINIGQYEAPILSSQASNALISTERNIERNRVRFKDKYDRATVEQVLDPRTRIILFKLLNKRIISELNGCISTGKEANVYHAPTKTEQQYAIKIYKTSILTFKDRAKYVVGEFRYRNGYSRSNPRKMVKTWAEKEFRNLSRMYKHDLNVPQPILLKSHVLVMSFIGKGGWPAPKLKSVALTETKAREIYRDVVIMMWKMYNMCKLIHGDLSEFNLLYLDGEVHIIDVSQSVEHDHPFALELLRKDCANVNDFFAKKNVAVMSVQQLTDFITDPSITTDNMEECLDAINEEVLQKRMVGLSIKEQV